MACELSPFRPDESAPMPRIYLPSLRKLQEYNRARSVRRRAQSLLWDQSRRARASFVLIAAARYLAAHSPTARARHQTAQIARRLMHGGALHEDESENA